MHKNSENIDIELLIAGDESAFNTAYHLYAEKIYRLAFRFLKNEAQCEEIVQETFLKLWLSRLRLDPSGNLWLYLYVIAKRLSFDAYKEICKSSALTEKLLLNLHAIRNTTEDEILANELECFTESVISKLPNQQRLIFKLSRLEGLSHQEIASQLNISPNTVKNHMVEALKTIKMELKYSDLIYFLALFYMI
ncbi:RNA polymerase sigma-70 factor, ECF subfamily [Pedobacter sp. ok626]|uniref:RNA polymerase sigma factor n=1 Tax=Pedobacter sp. ok626 TaxID=1761882 RepID=UPI00089144CD|nr:RNA polymerase sigma-70 factor [Pedobacter sp. ok626]SDJ99345.1 RNA polymerase sigma-70 factor, ECF subfamily [Pedobacter sp. ok626]